MYCVIQEMNLKKENKYGAPKEIIIDSFEINGTTKYTYSYSKERFKRPIKKAFKISINKSYRQDGIIKKIQYVLGTISYYDLLEWSWYEFLEKRIDKSSTYFQCNIDTIFNCIESKLDILENSVRKEFQQTEEYKTRQKHEKIIQEHIKNKKAFAEKYCVDENEYDYCYDVFGNLRNPTYLEDIKSYYKNKQSNHNDYDDFFKKFFEGSGSNSNSSYSVLNSGNYTEEERLYLKKFYKVLSVKYHPDNNPNNNTDSEMKLLNKLKKEWNI